MLMHACREKKRFTMLKSFEILNQKKHLDMFLISDLHSTAPSSWFFCIYSSPYLQILHKETRLFSGSAKKYVKCAFTESISLLN